VGLAPLCIGLWGMLWIRGMIECLLIVRCQLIQGEVRRIIRGWEDLLIWLFGLDLCW
jgi:hypothetical protein